MATTATKTLIRNKTKDDHMEKSFGDEEEANYLKT
jgi:hypothetical protein